MKIDALAISITEMEMKDAIKFILKLRSRRRLAPVKTPTKKRSQSKKKKQPSISKIINSLTASQVASLLEQLEA